jgi:plastocyanin
MPCHRHLRLGLVCAATALTLLGCGTSSKASKPTTTTGSPTTATTTAAGADAITIHNLMFSPTPLSAKVGDTVTVTNKDGFDHTFTADDGSFDTGPFSSGSKNVKLATAGTIDYHCKIHTFMHGTLQVRS